MLNATEYVVSMFPGVAIVNYVQENDQKDRFYAQAEVILSHDSPCKRVTQPKDPPRIRERYSESVYRDIYQTSL